MKNIVEIARDKIAMLQAEIDNHRKFLRLAEVLGYEIGLQPADIIPAPTSKPNRAARSVAPFYTAAVKSAVREYLTNNGPSTVGDLLPIAKKHGFNPPTNNAKGNLSARLSGGKEFINFPGHGYWPVNLDYPACDYTAPTVQ